MAPVILTIEMNFQHFLDGRRGMYEKRGHQMLKMQVCDFEKEQKHKF
jgi:hypothetical protein